MCIYKYIAFSLHIVYVIILLVHTIACVKGFITNNNIIHKEVQTSLENEMYNYND